ncbi:MAG: glycosyltransferase family 2 protein [Herpetosiphonaceae bacterium]|nr:glycosyltransferase family 2 protein [Herpetosiphonaceae bacterium]
MIDILIPNYNGRQLLPTCLDALAQQTRQDFRITVVDDGSTDGSVEFLRQAYPHVNVLPFTENRGLVVAVNRAIAQTTAPFVVLLNNDTEAESEWLTALIGALERWPQYAFAASKLRLFDERSALHAAGDTYTAWGIPGNRGVWQEDCGQYDAVSEVFGPCAGAAAYRRAALQALAVDGQVLDEALFMYCEDVDLNLRAHLAGLRTVFVPSAVVYHRLSATAGGSLASYYCGRNFIAVWVKNMPAPIIRRYWPHFVLAQLGIAVDALRNIRGEAARARLRGQLRGLRDLPQFMRKRRRTLQPELLTSSLHYGRRGA